MSSSGECVNISRDASVNRNRDTSATMRLEMPTQPPSHYPPPGPDFLTDMAMRPLTRVRKSAEAVERAERDLHETRLRHFEVMMAARAAGHSLAEIGLALGVSRQRVHAFLKWGAKEKAKRRRQTKRKGAR
jgi:hypothetical protein